MLHSLRPCLAIIALAAPAIFAGCASDITAARSTATDADAPRNTLPASDAGTPPVLEQDAGVWAPAADAGSSAVDEPSLRFTAVAAGDAHACALRSDGTLLCWGSNASGELGLGAPSPREDVRVIPTPAGVIAAAVATGAASTCIISSDQRLFCAGDNSNGRLGLGDALADQIVTSFTEVDPGHRYRQVALHSGSTCAIDTVGSLRCWGDGSTGQLGNGTSTGVTSPVAGPSGFGAMAVAMGAGFGCAVGDDRSARCWGNTWNGQMPFFTPSSGTFTADAVSVPSAAGLVDIVTGDYHSCARSAAGEAWCWGLNNERQLGQSTTSNTASPATVSGLTGVTSVAAGSNFSCATANGEVYCWGSGTHAQLGDDTLIASATPVAIAAVRGAAKVSAGNAFACVLDDEGCVSCWGAAAKGQLGATVATANRGAPERIRGALPGHKTCD